MALKLSVLDQSLARTADQTTEALHETIAMAQFCETLGYHRFWVSEHHAFPSVAGSAPEVLIAALGAATQRIRLGSGGVMLPHYSAYKIAEVFSVLASLYPDRIDLGVGRAPGADMATAMALATDGRPKFERFPELVSELSDFLWQPISEPLVSPKAPIPVPIWMLGSSPDSALLAAQRGLPYNLAAFINAQVNPRYIQYYREQFQPSERLESPYSMLTISVFCADTEERARALHLTHDINLFRFFSGQNNGVYMTPEDAQDYPMNPQLAAFVESRSSTRAVGTADQVADKITQLATEFAVDEVMAVTNMYYFEDRKRSFELLKNAL